MDRARVLAHRFAAHGLAQRGPLPAEVLSLGVQDSPPGSLPLALAARTDDTPGDTMLVWSHRGAPHLHLSADLPALATACFPASEKDATVRLGWQRKRLEEIGDVREALRVVAAATADVLTAGPRVKGELSGEVTARIPAPLSPWCEPCGTHHVAEQLLRMAGLPAGTALRPGTTPVVLEAIPDWPGPPDHGDPARVARDYVALFAPATAADVAGFVGTSVTAIRPFLPELPAAEEADPSGTVRLLPPSDPYLQARDREFLVPEKAHRSAIWRPIGSPGVVAVDGEVVGVWRTRRSEAERVRAVRDVPSVRVGGT
jgi:hypothetical protein